ncbi:MAG: amidohydrolase family protein [Planctomycetota bacterium]
MLNNLLLSGFGPGLLALLSGVGQPRVATPLTPLTPLSPLSTSPASVDAPTLALHVARVHVGDGTVLTNATVVVRGGKVVSVGENVPPPEGALLVELEGELSPGLIALRDFSTARGENVDSTRNIMPTADLALAFDKRHRDVAALSAEGITSVVLAAPGSELVGGLAAVVDPGSGEVTKRKALLCIGAGTRALSFNRYPTSTAAQYAELDELFGAGESVYGQAKQGGLPLLIDVTDRADVQRAAAFAKRHGLKGALVGAIRWGDVAAAVKDAGLAIVVGPIQIGGFGPAAAEAVRAAQAGVKIGFAADSPDNHPALLRATAAQCVRAGMAPGAAVRALTGDAASIAGVADRTGRVAAGLEADLVLWSGAPTDLTSRILKVWSDGQLVFEAAPNASSQGGQE